MKQKELIKISVAKHFSTTPGPRYRHEGKYSGDDFRDHFLAPCYFKAVIMGVKLVIDLDGTAGFGTGFLEEVFGGMIRRKDIHADTFTNQIKLVSTEVPEYADEVLGYMEAAAAARAKVDVDRFMEENGLGPEDMVDNLVYPPAK